MSVEFNRLYSRRNGRDIIVPISIVGNHVNLIDGGGQIALDEIGSVWALQGWEVDLLSKTQDAKVGDVWYRARNWYLMRIDTDSHKHNPEYYECTRMIFNNNQELIASSLSSEPYRKTDLKKDAWYRVVNINETAKALTGELKILSQFTKRHEYYEQLAQQCEARAQWQQYRANDQWARAALKHDLVWDVEADAIRGNRIISKEAFNKLSHADRKCYEMRGLKEFVQMQSDKHKLFMYW